MHWLSLENVVGMDELKHESPAIGCNNITAVTWVYKFRKNNSKVATNIFCALATTLHRYKAGLFLVDHISGFYNTLADLASHKHTKDLKKFCNCLQNIFTTTKRILARVCPQRRDYVQNLLRTTAEEVNDGVMA